MQELFQVNRQARNRERGKITGAESVANPWMSRAVLSPDTDGNAFDTGWAHTRAEDRPAHPRIDDPL
jgi:hypothetical protein